MDLGSPGLCEFYTAVITRGEHPGATERTKLPRTQPPHIMNHSCCSAVVRDTCASLMYVRADMLFSCISCFASNVQTNTKGKVQPVDEVAAWPAHYCPHRHANADCSALLVLDRESRIQAPQKSRMDLPKCLRGSLLGDPKSPERFWENQ